MTEPLPDLTPRILVVDDDTEHAATLARLLRRAGFEPIVAHDARQALDALREADPDLVVTDLVMPGTSGVELLHDIRRLHPDVEVVLMTAFGTVERAVEAMKAGAIDFIVKPIRRDDFLRAVGRGVQRRRLARENLALRAEVERLRGTPRLIGEAPPFVDALRAARQAARSDATVLLLGASGTGKELFAREVHARSARAAGPFIPLHCAALPESIIESELFGHEAGAFTGASRRRIGAFEAAHRGTLFLDEIGELPLSVQVKLLRVLQEGEIQRVGASTPIRVDVRIVAATHRDLPELVRDGRFREDLYYRLAVVPIHIPDLAAREDDIPRLARHFAAEVGMQARGRPFVLTDAALDRLRAMPLPGNVRQLRNVIERAIVFDLDGVLDTDDLHDAGAPSAGATSPGTRTGTRTLAVEIGTPLAEVERRVILATLEWTGGDKAGAAQILQVGRRTIYRKLDAYRAGVFIGDLEDGDPDEGT